MPGAAAWRTTGRKRCSHCRETKPLSAFHYWRTGRQAGQPQAWCKACVRQAERDRRQADPEAFRKRQRELRQRRMQDPEYAALQYRKRTARRFGLSLDEYDAMVEEAKRGCPLCGRPVNGKRISTGTLDHDHKTGRRRKILCRDCNSGLGFFQDDPELLERAAAYVRAFREPAPTA